MKQGKTVAQLGAELERQAKNKRDYIADTRSMTVETKDGTSRLILPVNSHKEDFVVSDLAHRQIAARLQIPFPYYERMRERYPSLLDSNVNGWLARVPERRMLRTLDGKLRAFLSDRYRRLDNFDLAEAVLPVIGEMRGGEVVSAEITESHLYIKTISKTVKAEISPGDVCMAGLVISNSEVGLGAVRVEPLVFRLVCQNGLISQDFAQKRYHVGRQAEGDAEAYEIFRDETLAADDKAFFMKVQDTVRTAVDKAKFSLVVDRMRFAAGQSAGDDPVKAVEVLADRFQFNQAERGSILRHFIMGGDLTQYGLINAVTRSSQNIGDYNRATDLERFGGEMLAMPVNEWQSLMKKAA